MEFVNSMRKKGKLIMGIGHRVKSVSRSPTRNSLMLNLLFRLLYSSIRFLDLIFISLIDPVIVPSQMLLGGLEEFCSLCVVWGEAPAINDFE